MRKHFLLCNELSINQPNPNTNVEFFFVNEQHSNEVSSIKFTLLGLLIGSPIVMFGPYIAVLIATAQEVEFTAATPHKIFLNF